MSVCPIAHNRQLRPKGFDWRLLVYELFANIGIPLDNSAVLTIAKKENCVKKIQVFGSLLTSLLCIVGELSGGGSVAVAVGISDR